MPHIFRFHKGRNNNITDWKASDKIEPADVREIMDKTNIPTTSAGSSIPTPIARMFLFKTAFEIMAAQVGDDQVESKSIYAGLVSETLDVLELLYKSGSDSEKFEYVKWEFESSQNKDKLIEFFGPQHGHRLLAESFIQASSQPPFNGKIEITLIYYKEGAKKILMGGTSPFTFVFTSPNFKRKRNEKGFHDIFGLITNDILFNTNYKQLHERDQSFIIYVESLIKSPGINESFNGFSEYVTNILKRSGNKYNGTPPQLQDIKFNDIPLSVSNIRIKQISEDDYKATINQFSDFKIDLPSDSPYSKEELNPLFLLSNMDMDGQYTSPSSHWSNKTSISPLEYPENTVEEIKIRELPGIRGFKYPFLTKFDILERSLITLPAYALNDDRFITLIDNQEFILPIKPLFFAFFPLKKIGEYVKVSRIFKEVGKPAEIVVQVDIPIKGPTMGKRIISFTQIYKKDPDLNSDEDKDKYSFIDYKGILGIFPFIKATEKDLKYINTYTIASFEKTNTGDPLGAVKFLKHNGTEEITSSPSLRSDYLDVSTKTTYYHDKESFDMIQLKFLKNNINFGGIIIPKMKNVINGNDEYVYAIDFGTSNTHIEWAHIIDKTAKNTSPFEINEKNMVMTMLNKPVSVKEQDGAVFYNDYTRFGKHIDSVRLISLREFVPYQIGSDKGATTKFPFRTATFESRSFKESRHPLLFNDANIGYNIEKDTLDNSLKYQTDIKWQLENDLNDSLKKNRVRIFFRQLLLMIRSHALLSTNSSCNLDKLKIAMSYPTSMDDDLKKDLVKHFNEEMRDIFNIKTNPNNPNEENHRAVKVIESLAPYYYLLKQDTNIQHDIYCNIDVGGGTSDIVLVNKKDGVLECYCNSVKFAGQQLWGSVSDEFDPNDNGFIMFYLKFLQLKYKQDYEKIKRIIDSKNNRTQDLVSYLFYDESLNFKQIFTQCRELKVPLLLHYASLLYYVAKFCDLKGIELPKTLSFSGKGSEYISLIFNSEEHLKLFTKKALHVFSGSLPHVEFNIKRSPDPKVITAKGSAIYAAKPLEEKKEDIFGNTGTDLDHSGEVMLKTETDIYFGFQDKNLEKGDKTYGDFRESTPEYESVLLNCVDFLQCFFGNADLVKGSEVSLSINNLIKYKSFFLKNTSDFSVLKNGVLRNSYKSALAEKNMLSKVNDSPFFFAFNTSLIELSKYIAGEAIKNINA